MEDFVFTLIFIILFLGGLIWLLSWLILFSCWLRLLHSVYREKIRPTWNKARKLDILLLWIGKKRKIKNCFRIVRSYINRPYPFQLWIAPRRYTGKRDADTVTRHSPPGFDEQLNGNQDGEKENCKEAQNRDEYALFLYPDNLSTYWIIFFLFTALPGFFLGIPCEKHLFASLATAVFFFIAAYRTANA